MVLLLSLVPLCLSAEATDEIPSPELISSKTMASLLKYRGELVIKKSEKHSKELGTAYWSVDVRGGEDFVTPIQVQFWHAPARLISKVKEAYTDIQKKFSKEYIERSTISFADGRKTLTFIGAGGPGGGDVTYPFPGPNDRYFVVVTITGLSDRGPIDRTISPQYHELLKTGRPFHEQIVKEIDKLLFNFSPRP
jgi:hypothetical protein